MAAAAQKAEAKKPAADDQASAADAPPISVSLAPAPAQPIDAPATALPRVMARSDIIKLMEFGRNSWHIVAPADHTLEQVLDLGYAWHRHDQIRPGDKIEIRHALFHYEVEILVCEVDREAQAIIGFYRKRDLRTEELHAPDLTGASIEELGAHKWCVRLGSYLMKTGFDTQLEAQAWLRKKQARGA